MKFVRVAQNLDRLAQSGTYYVRWTRLGQKRRQSLRTTDRKIAEAKLRELLPRLTALKPQADRLDFGQLAKLWFSHVLASRDLKESTKLDRQYHLKAIYKLWPELEQTRIDRITADHCADWWRRRQPQVSPQRHNNERDSLEQIFQVAVDRHWLLDNPAARLARRDIPEPQIRFPDKHDFVQVIKHLESRRNLEAAWFLELLAYSGLRRGEAARLKWSDIDYERGLLRIHISKNRMSRVVPLSPALRELLQRIPRIIGRDTVLPIRQCRDAFNMACEALQLPKFSHHDLRRFYTVNMIEAGADIPTVATILGHKDAGRTLTKWYLRIRPDHLQRVGNLGVWSAQGELGGVTEKSRKSQVVGT